MLNRVSKLLTVLLFLPLLGGCGDFLLFDPKGPIAAEQMDLIILSFLVMMIVVIPVFIMTIWFAIRYRANNKKARYEADWEHSNLIELVVWSVPLIIIIVLGIITYNTSHSLDPRQALKSDKETLRVQVVALDWKWLFIYPEQEIATVNELAMPIGVPVEFLITSDTVMNSFFVPQLGSMIYAMAGMENQLYLRADEEGTYRGLSAHYSGFGFSGMKFKAHAMNDGDFESWIATVKASPNVLNKDAYSKLVVKTKVMFNRIIEKYTGEQNGQ